MDFPVLGSRVAYDAWMSLIDSQASCGDGHVAADRWLAEFALDACLHDHAVCVVTSLPEAVRADLMLDPAFTICDYEPGSDAVMRVPAGIPGRAVVLKRTLRRRPCAFVRWLIAHELAHAYLRNEGRWPGDDPEVAADALAAEWGFPKP